MAVKLILEDPVVARMGETMEEVGWGPWQYPTLAKADDGRLVLSCSSGPDSSTSFGHEIHWAVSKDDGRSWEISDPSIKKYDGLKLRDGRILRRPARKITPVKKEDLPAPIATHPIQGEVYLYDDLKDGLMSKEWYFTRTDPDGSVEELYSPIRWPYMATTYLHDALLTPFPFGKPHQAPDGSVWVTHYGIIPSPENGGYSPFYNTFFLRSKDCGESWELMSWIPYTPDLRDFAGAYTEAEGFCEVDISFMPDGSMLSLLRSGSTTPSYISHSPDGITWEKPVLFDKCGVWPTLLTLDCGVTVTGYGRPGFFLRATDDPAGRVWEDPIELLPYKDRSDEANEPPENPGADWQFGTCSYCDLLPLGPDEFILAYSDFYYPAPDGKKRKAVLTRRVKVVKS